MPRFSRLWDDFRRNLAHWQPSAGKASPHSCNDKTQHPEQQYPSQARKIPPRKIPPRTALASMGAFQKNKYRSAADANTFAARYRAAMAKHPFLLFGLPFMAVIIGGSFVLTPATAIRYERHDRKVKMVSREDELGIGKAGRRVNMREEYNVGALG